MTFTISQEQREFLLDLLFEELKTLEPYEELPDSSKPRLWLVQSLFDLLGAE